MTLPEVLLQPVAIGDVKTRNRFLRAGTAETMADDAGRVTPPLVELYRRLAAHQVGLIFTGHMFVHERGRATKNQTSISDDDKTAGLSAIPEAVHFQGGRIFAQLGHAGSQSKVVDDLLSPGVEPNLMTGRRALRPAGDAEIEEAIQCFARATGRAREAGFDGVHVHGANGYLISSFCSPHSNRREDAWGGSPEARGSFARRVVAAIREVAPAPFPVTMKLGFWDAAEGGLSLEEAVDRAAELLDAGVDLVEVSSNLMAAPEHSARRYVGVDKARAMRDLIFTRMEVPPAPQAYFSSFAKALRARAPEGKIALVGGIRSIDTMAQLVAAGTVDLLSMARPFIREPDLVEKLERGHSVSAACTSCNLCFRRSEEFSLRCWRKPRRNLVANAFLSLRDRMRSG